MEFKNKLSSFMISVAVAASVFLILFGAFLKASPELYNELVSYGTAVASFLISLVFAALFTVSAGTDAEVQKKENNQKLS